MCFNLFNANITLKDNGFFDGFTDWHSHLLPGVDDGVKTMDESLKILALYETLGIREVWFTPHIMEDVPNTPKDLRERFAEIQTTYKGSIKLHLAAEHMLDTLFEQRLEKNDLLPLGEDGYNLLVETSYFNPPIDLYGFLQKIKSKGYFPVLAHPERYMYMNDADYRRLKDMGVRFQLNVPSIVGLYDKIALKKAKRLLKAGFYNCIGTDTHSLNMFYNSAKGKVKKKELQRMNKINSDSFC